VSSRTTTSGSSTTRIAVFFVTHLFDLANGFSLRELTTALFLLLGIAKLLGGPLANQPARRVRLARGGYLLTALFTAAIGLATTVWQAGSGPRPELARPRRAGLFRPLLPVALFELGNITTTLLILRSTQLLEHGAARRPPRRPWPSCCTPATT
jgi:hypothetical protein